LSVGELRTSWRYLRREAAELPDPDRLADLYADLQKLTRDEGRSLRSMSSLLAAGALRAGVRIGQIHIFDYYEEALVTIATEGLAAYSQRKTMPYLGVARGHFNPRATTYTERLLQRLRREEPTGGASRQ
jgi:hypothetical protein